MDWATLPGYKIKGFKTTLISCYLEKNGNADVLFIDFTYSFF